MPLSLLERLRVSVREEHRVIGLRCSVLRSILLKRQAHIHCVLISVNIIGYIFYIGRYRYGIFGPLSGPTDTLPIISCITNRVRMSVYSSDL